MRKIILFIFLFIAFSTVSGQSKKKIDSLMTCLKTAKNNKSKVDVYNKLSYEYSTNDFKKSTYYAEKALFLAKKIRYQAGIITSYLRKGLAFDANSQLDKCIEIYNNALKLSQNYHNDSLIVASYNYIATVLLYKGNFSKAYDYLFDIEKLTRNKFNFERGLMYFRFAHFYILLKNNKKAGDYIKKGKPLIIKYGDKRNKAWCYNNIGHFLNLMGDSKGALDNHYKSLKISKSINDLYGIALSYNSIGEVFLSLNKGGKFLDYFLKSLEIRKKLRDKYGIAYTNCYIGKYYLENNQIKKARKHLESSFNNFEDLQTPEMLKEVSEYLGETFYKLKKYPEAYTYIQKANKLNNQLLGARVAAKTARLEIENEIEKKEKTRKIEDQKRLAIEKSRRKNELLYRILLFILLGLISIVFIITFISLRFIRKKNQELMLHKVEIEEQNEELRQQNDEIETQFEYANQQADEIARQNNELSLYHEQLEELVKERTANLEEATQKAKESDDLKSSFLGNLSHEVRTPMNAILGFIELFQYSLSKEKKTEYMRIIRKNAQSLMALIDDMVDISKLQLKQLSISNKVFNLEELMLRLLKEYEDHKTDIGRNNIELIYKNHSENPNFKINSDPIRLYQVLSQLIGNALKFTEEGKVCFYYKQQLETIEFFIEDTGIGISEENKNIIFENFRQIDSTYKREYGGTGLGLAIVKGLINLFKGKIILDSYLGKGTKIKISIPL